MDWTSLGHACWLIEAVGLRLLCDPLIGVEHYGGVFEVSPRRRLRAEALRPDFLLISHRHPDHFDIPSLAELAAIDPETVVVTPDELVAEAARELGFRSVKQIGSGQHVQLDGLALVTTESLADDEWGVMVATEDGVVWNMVDTVLADAAHARTLAQASLEALGHQRLTLALVQGQPMLEVAAQLGRALTFPHARYASTLAQLAALDAAALVPSAAGTAHTEAFAWLNTIVYPVDEARFVRDLAKVCPAAQLFPSRLGARYRVHAGRVELDEQDGDALIERLAGQPSQLGCDYRPFEVPALRDPGASFGIRPRPEPAPSRPGSPEHVAVQRDEIAPWIEADLSAALVGAYPNFGVSEPLSFVVEVVFADAREAWTLVVGAEGASLRPGIDPGWDAYNLVAGSLLVDVIAGRRHWGDLLLSGALRAFTRAYVASPAGCDPANVAEIFLYYALSYAESTRRAVAWELGRVHSARLASSSR